jgi:methylated-DNA-[protein]-cysteine S-methyltransferase
MTTSNPTTFRTIESPIGVLTLAGRGGVLTHLLMTDQAHAPVQDTWEPAPDGAFAEVVAQLGAYFDGDLTDFDVDLELDGTPFQREVWAALREIPYGETWSYGELAEHIGKPGAARAVGLANGRNPVAIIVPCHRVIGANGSLTGYGGGLPRKQHLLQLEQERTEPRLDLGA